MPKALSGPSKSVGFCRVYPEHTAALRSNVGTVLRNSCYAVPVEAASIFTPGPMVEEIEIFFT